MQAYAADLHVHSVLSPCADDLMLPSLVLAAACQAGLDMVAVVDHNCAENAAAFVAASHGTGVTVIPGIEVTTREEVHVLTLFRTVDEAIDWQQVVYAHLPQLSNNERTFGTQLVVDRHDELLRLNHRLLITATDLSLVQVADLVGARGGLAIPAHIDRLAFGLIGQLGFVPPELDVPAFEVSRLFEPRLVGRLDRNLSHRAIIQSSDAHQLSDIGGARTLCWLEEATFAELQAACRGERRMEYFVRRPAARRV